MWHSMVIEYYKRKINAKIIWVNNIDLENHSKQKKVVFDNFVVFRLDRKWRSMIKKNYLPKLN